MIKLSLPFWLSGKQLIKLRNAAQRYWQKAEQWIRWPLEQLDIDNCTLEILDLIAWQRDITRIKKEPEWLYRLRVKYAYVNAVDAGSVAGFVRIFDRLKIGYVELEERKDGRDWDIITLVLTDNQISQNHDLLMTIVYQYGRTCRRYEFSIINSFITYTAVGEFNNDYMTFHAEADTDLKPEFYNGFGSFNNDTQTFIL